MYELTKNVFEILFVIVAAVALIQGFMRIRANKKNKPEQEQKLNNENNEN